MAESAYALELRHLDMKFHDLQVLYDVDFTLRPGEIKGLVGKNGAGKSTLLKIVQGLHTPTAGTIRIFGKEIPPSAPMQERGQTVGMVYQDFSLIADMSVVENMFLNDEPHKGLLIDKKQCIARARALFDKYGINIDPLERVGNLNTSDMQMVEICKQIVREKKILLLDEPTAALEAEQASKLYSIIRQLKQEGISAVFITHHLKEIMENCDSVDVLRDGRLVMSSDVKDVTLNDIISAMLGESSGEFVRQHTYAHITREKPLLEMNNVTSATLQSPISLKLYPGEVLGIAGLKGSGRTELFHILFGLDRQTGGEILLDGRRLTLKKPGDAVRAGIFLIPENRQTQGLSLEHSIYRNVTLPWLKSLRGSGGLLDDKRGKKTVGRLLQDLQVKYERQEAQVQSLSGGNQQKIVIAKALGAHPKILLMDDPTYGVDVHAKAQIMGIVNDFKKEGGSVIFVSSELEEIAYNCDRVLVMHRHRIVGEMLNEREGDITQEQLTAAIQ